MMLDCFICSNGYQCSMASSQCTHSPNFLKKTPGNNKNTACFPKFSHKLLFSHQFATCCTPVSQLITTGLGPSFCPHNTNQAKLAQAKPRFSMPTLACARPKLLKTWAKSGLVCVVWTRLKNDPCLNSIPPCKAVNEKQNKKQKYKQAKQN